jgi:CDP-diglyceride synthetase
MAITMSGVAVGLVVFVISGMIERGWFYPFELNLFELFTNPYVAIPCFVFLIINVTLSYRQRRRKSRVGNIED